MTGVTITDIKQSATAKVQIGGNNAALAHSGDTLTLYCPPTLGSVSIHVEIRTRAHWVNQLTNESRDSGNYAHTVDKTLTTGQTWQIGPVVEQAYSDSAEATTAAQNAADKYMANTKAYVDDQNIFVTITGAENPDGSVAAVSTESDWLFYWHIFTLKDDEDMELASDSCLSIDAGKNAIKAYAEVNKVAYYRWTVTDASGGIKALGTHAPKTGADLSWLWWGLGLLAVGIFAAITWRYFIAGKVIGGVQMPGPFIKGKLGQAAGAAPAPAAAPSSVAVAK